MGTSTGQSNGHIDYLCQFPLNHFRFRSDFAQTFYWEYSTKLGYFLLVKLDAGLGGLNNRQLWLSCHAFPCRRSNAMMNPLIDVVWVWNELMDAVTSDQSDSVRCSEFRIQYYRAGDNVLFVCTHLYNLIVDHYRTASSMFGSYSLFGPPSTSIDRLGWYRIARHPQCRLASSCRPEYGWRSFNKISWSLLPIPT